MKNQPVLAVFAIAVLSVLYLGYETQQPNAQSAAVSAALPACVISVEPAIIAAGDSATLTWSSKDFTTGHWLYGVAPDKNGRSVLPHGSLVVTPKATTAFTLRLNEMKSLISACATRVTVVDPSSPLLTQKCQFNGSSVAHNATVTAYQAATVPFGSTCASQVRTCTNGTLSGTYAYSACAPEAPRACTFNGLSIGHGSTTTAYQSTTVPSGNTCASQVRTCTNGTLSGTYAYSACAPEAPGACIFNGTSVNHGGTITAYETSSVPFGSTCVSQVRTCTNGTLSGTYSHGACTVGQPAACVSPVRIVQLKAGITGPANRYATHEESVVFRDAAIGTTSIAHAQSKEFYTKPYSQNGAPCSSFKVSRTCTLGTLSGSASLKYYDKCIDLPTTSTASHHPRRSDRPLSPRADAELMGLAFTSFNANKIAWTYARNFQSQGLAFPIQASLPGGHTNVSAEACPGMSAQSGPNADISSASWRTSMLDFVKPKINAGIRSFQQDDPSHVFSACATPTEVNSFLAWFHETLRTYAQSVAPGATLSFSSNFTTYELSSAWIYQEYDFIESEIFAESGQSVLTAMRRLQPVYKKLDYPSLITIRSDNTLANQRGIAQAYAFGVVPIIPWDVFYNFGPRYFGNPSDYADFYKLVKDRPALFDDYPMVELTDINSSAVRLAGVTGDTFIRKHQSTATNKTVHIVRTAATSASMVVKLSAGTFTSPPTAYVTNTNSTPVAITPVLKSGYYEYTIPNAPLWTILMYK